MGPWAAARVCGETHQIHLPHSGKVISEREQGWGSDGVSVADVHRWPAAQQQHPSRHAWLHAVRSQVERDCFEFSSHLTETVDFSHNVSPKYIQLIHVVSIVLTVLANGLHQWQDCDWRARTALSPVPSAHTHSPPEHMGCVKCQIKTDGSAITLHSLIMSPYCAAKFTSARR